MHEARDASNQRDSLGLLQIIAQLWAGRWLIISVTTVFVLTFAVVAWRMTPIYRVSTILVPVSQERAGLGGALSSVFGSLGGLASLAGVNIGSSATATDEALAVLSSRQFIERFITERKLLPVLYSDKWDSAAGRWTVPPDREPTVARGVKYFVRDVLNVSQDRKTGLLTLQIEWKDRIAAADWANDLVERLNSGMRARAIANADASLAFLRRELDATSVVETRQAVSRLMEAQINSRMISTVTDEFSFRVVDPAVAPERGDIARPKKLLMILFGIFAGLVVGSSAVLIRGLLRHSPSQLA